MIYNKKHSPDITSELKWDFVGHLNFGQPMSTNQLLFADLNYCY